MKGILLVVLFVSVISCKKQRELKDFKKDIVGSWEIEKVVGYPFTQPSYLPGNGQVIVIKKDGGFERWKHDTLVFNGAYTIQRKKDCVPRNSDIIFSTNETSSSTYFYVEIGNAELTLGTPGCYSDVSTVYYRKIK
jgi:hypothetical protein